MPFPFHIVFFHDHTLGKYARLNDVTPMFGSRSPQAVSDWPHGFLQSQYIPQEISLQPEPALSLNNLHNVEYQI